MPETRLVALGAADGRDRWVVVDDGCALAVFADDGRVRVVDAACPHRSGPLIEGVLRDGAVVCPWHWYTFDLDTGRCRTTGEMQLRTYPVVSRDGALYAEVPILAPVPSWAERLRAHARGARP